LHRLILLSSTYQMSSRPDNEKALAIDPANTLLWRQRLQRLEAECLWDAALSVSGELNPLMGGRGFFPHLDGEVLAGESRPGLDWDLSGPSEQSRRSIYTYICRTLLLPSLEAFDYSNTSSPLNERPVTTVAPQALMLLNGYWVHRRAEAFADRLIQQAGPDPHRRITLAYELALARRPSSSETHVGLDFLQRQLAGHRALRSRLTFYPDVPSSLAQEYMNHLQPGDYLRGPRHGWSYYRGRWSAAYDGIRSMDRQRGPFALHNGPTFENGVVTGTLLLQPGAEFASILLRSVADGDEQRGYEIRFDPRQQRLALLRHATDVTILKEAPATLHAGKPFTLTCSLDGSRIQVWMSAADSRDSNSNSAPVDSAHLVLDCTDPHPVSGAGRFGLRTVGAALNIDHLQLRTTSETVAIDPDQTPLPDERIEREAWQSFCLLLLNLNEFIYVD